MFVVVDLADSSFESEAAITAITSDSDGRDEVLRHCIFALTNKRRIVGLPAIRADKLWIVPAVREDEYFFVNQNIRFM
jgi:hypothetical protein